MRKLIFGGASISGEGGGYGFGEISESESLTLLEEAFENGFKVFDTAPIYGFGTSETRIGKAFQKNREKVQIISKCGVDWHDNGRVNMTNDPKVAIKMLEASLKRLETEYIDFYLVHWPDENVDIRYTYEALSKAKERGHIKYLGLCNTNADELALAEEIDKVHVIQSEFNLFQQKNFDFVPKDSSVWLQGWGTFNKGILSARLDSKRQTQKKFDETDCRKNAPWWKTKDVLPQIEKFEKFQKILKAYNVNPVHFSLWLGALRDQPVDSIMGPRNKDQLYSTLEALKTPVDQEIMGELKKEWEKLES